jgi:Uma2 family endonuclease
MSTETTALTAPAAPAAVAPPAPGVPAPVGVEIVLDGEFRIPGEVRDLASFRRWALTFECMPHFRLAWLAGVLWVDRSMEQAFSHNDVKTEIAGVLRQLVRATKQGRYYGDGMSLSNPAADLSTVPDGVHVSFAALRDGRIRQVPGRRAGVVEFEGSPEMVLEVVSDSSVEKDTDRLPVLYHRAGVQEFWRVDARGELRFEVLRRTEAGYVQAQEQAGWWRSDVFGRCFQLTRQGDEFGQPEYFLAVRD